MAKTNQLFRPYQYAALYLRVSTSEQNTYTQYQELWAAAVRAGWSIAEVSRTQASRAARAATSVRPSTGCTAPSCAAKSILSWHGQSSARPLAAGPDRIFRRTPGGRLRPVSSSTRHRYHDAGRPRAVPDARGVRRVRAGHHRRARQGGNRPREPRGSIWDGPASTARSNRRSARRSPPARVSARWLGSAALASALYSGSGLSIQSGCQGWCRSQLL